ncbi:hypothetical protein B0H11DRAFT_2253739 [Mycena galericulata]|nr:hypothetical protein B0H11DRAFT_2253739 [Mycena galericulata]
MAQVYPRNKLTEINAIKFQVAFEEAMLSPVEAPWYGVWHFTMENGQLATLDRLIGEKSGRLMIYNGVGVQIPYSMVPEDSSTATKKIPDLEQVLIKYHFSDKSHSSITTMLVENKRRLKDPPDALALLAAFSVVWTQVHKQAAHFLAEHPDVDSIPTIATVGEWWSFDDLDRDAIQSMDTYKPDSDEEWDEEELSFSEEEELEENRRAVREAKEAREEAEAKAFMDPQRIFSNARELKDYMFSLNSVNGDAALELVRQHLIDLHREIWAL